jgi:hypothetical protein
MAKNLTTKTPRYYVYQFDGSTFVVADNSDEREICICANYDDWEDAGERAQRIADLLNENPRETPISDKPKDKKAL